MMVTFNWDQIAWTTGIFFTWNAFLLAIIKWLLSRIITNIDSKIESLAKSMCSPERCEELKRVNRELTETRVELPMAYVRREDALRENTIALARMDALAVAQQQFVLRDDQIRSETVMHAKLDALAERIERLIDGRNKRGES